MFSSSPASILGDQSLAMSNAAILEELESRRALTVFVVQKILTPLVVLVGCLGNTVNIAVLTRPSMKSSTNCYLTALAIYDILYLLFAFSMSLTHYKQIGFEDSFIMYMTYVGKSMTDIASNTGIWLTLTFTVERYIVVSHPMRGVIWCTLKRAKQIIIVVCLSAALLTLPEFFAGTVVSQIVNATTNATRLISTDTSFANSAGYRLGYLYTNQALFTFLPLTLLFIFNVLLVRELLAAARRREVMTSRRTVTVAAVTSDAHSKDQQKVTPEASSKDQQKITMMLIAVVVVFIVCQLPSAVSVVYRYAARREDLSPESLLKLRIAGNYLNLLVMINSAINFILYSAFSTKYRKTFKRVFCTSRCLEVKGKDNKQATG